MYIITIVSIIIFLFFLVFLCINNHKAVLFYSAFSIILQPYLCIKYEAPAITVNFLLNFVIFLFYLPRINIIKKRNIRNPFIFRKVYALLICSFLFSVFVSDLGFSTLPNIVAKIIQWLVIIPFFYEIKNRNDIMYVLRCFLFCCSMLLIYGFFEFLTQHNYILDFFHRTVSENLMEGKLYYFANEKNNYRLGMMRIQSLMTISISWGGYCVCMIAFILLLKDWFSIQLSRSVLFALLSLLVSEVIIGGSRSALLFMIVVLLPYFFRKESFHNKTVLVIGLLFIVFAFGDSMISLLSSLSLSSDNNMYGSNTLMRINQFNAVIDVISNSPLFGLGAKGYLSAHEMNSDILGAESVWFQTLIENGLIGVLIKLYLYYRMATIMYHSVSTKDRYCALFFVLGWVLFVSATSSPGIDDSYFLYLIIIVYKTKCVSLANYLQTTQ